MARWDAETNVKFIQEYQSQVCLWDPNHENYKSRYARDKAYKSIAEAMDCGLTIKTVVTKIRSLRNTYNNEILKMKKCESYFSKIPWLHSLDFLRNIACAGSPGGELRKTHNNIQEFKLEHDEHDSDDGTLIPPRPTPPKRKRLKLRVPKAVGAYRTIPSRPTNENEFEIFGRNVAAQLQKLPIDIALESQELVLSVLRRQRMKAMNAEPSFVSVTPSTSAALGENGIVEEYLDDYTEE